MSRTTVLACISLFLCLYKTAQASCNDYKDCVTCTSHESWSGDPCRWCPVDLKCHAKGSLLNKCSITQNIIDPKKCGQVLPEYNAQIAYKMVLLSAVAYSNDATKYLSKAFPSETFESVTQVSKPCPGDALCSGFTAVTHASRAVVIAFRGTENFKQLIFEVLKVLTIPKVSFPAGGKVQAYFKNALDLVWNQLKQNVYALIERHPTYKIWVTGHSLGAAMASIASTAIVFEGKAQEDRVVLYTFGQPRVGDYWYARKHDELVRASWRVVHRLDVVVHLPNCYQVVKATGCLGNLPPKFGSTPYHHGTEIFYSQDSMGRDSPYKKCEGLPHNEDLGCSNSIFVWSQCFVKLLGDCVDNHKVYFGVKVGDWWKKA